MLFDKRYRLDRIRQVRFAGCELGALPLKPVVCFDRIADVDIGDVRKVEVPSGRLFCRCMFLDRQ